MCGLSMVGLQERKDDTPLLTRHVEAPVQEPPSVGAPVQHIAPKTNNKCLFVGAIADMRYEDGPIK